jgi:hypothetical protein
VPRHPNSTFTGRGWLRSSDAVWRAILSLVNSDEYACLAKLAVDTAAAAAGTIFHPAGDVAGH